MADAIYDTLTVEILAESSGTNGDGFEAPDWLKGVREFLLGLQGER